MGAVGRGCQARLGQTGVPRGRDPPRQQPLSPSPGPQLPVCKSLVCMGPGPGAGPCQGAWPAAPAPRRAACSPGECSNPGGAECCPGGSSGARDSGGDGPAAASTAAAAGGGRRQTLASQGARLGHSRGAWGGPGFGPAWGRMVNLEPMHTGEGWRE